MTPHQRIIAPLARKSIYHFQDVGQLGPFTGARGLGPKAIFVFSVSDVSF